ncbi:MAG: methylated-DNA--[protein]-cysteine S-methyltransferase [Burkholderiales bacterium]|nr:methylated-DNA--[protein]-cysteine S-methyltransferase [Burkholderiales bacterium]
MKHYLTIPSRLGTLRLLATDKGVAGVYFEQHKHMRPDSDSRYDPASTLLQEAARQISDYLAGHRQHFDLPLDMGLATPFQHQVWQALQTIPYGSTISYKQLAEKIKNPKAVRAVGAANGRNPLSMIIPCHRVIAASGDLHGYAGGLERKRVLLEMEKQTIGAIR